MLQRCRYEIRGVVQGVGFRPFVCRAAKQHAVVGWVKNDTRGVVIEIEGSPQQVTAFIEEVATRPPALSRILAVSRVSQEAIERRSHASFGITPSDHGGKREVLITPDAHVCDDCLQELFDPTDRRYRYPFINCTNCGPRFSITRDVPYDRAHTTMSGFPMCSACAAEYGDIQDRRFHAQPIACWACGPQVSLLRNDGVPLTTSTPIERAVELLREGAIFAVKGIGGYHIMVDPTHTRALERLRAGKHRPHRPFALVTDSLADAREFAVVDDPEARLLQSVPRPIVVLRKRSPEIFAEAVAPGQDSYGVMLAYTPLHHLLLRGNFLALVATSANVTSEPIAFRDDEALRDLSGIVDYFLTHDRPIHVRVDDSIVQSVRIGGESRTVMIRRARGFTPLPLASGAPLIPTLGLGAELKSTVSVAKEEAMFVSQHIGDLKNYKNYEFFKELTEHMLRTLEVRPELIACDLHPQFASTRYAEELGHGRLVRVQHHHAHMAACMYENGLQGSTIGVTFDGFGYGTDGTLWGGEFLLGDYAEARRVAHLLPFGLAGGDMAAREPYRVALALLSAACGYDRVSTLPLPCVTSCGVESLKVALTMLERGLNAPLTSSAGRLFDGVAALLGIRSHATFEGQAAMELEQLAATQPGPDEPLSFALIQRPDGACHVDWRPMIREMVQMLSAAKPDRARLARRFHTTLAFMVRDVCMDIRERTGVEVVVLTGGVFLNRLLVGTCHDVLQQAGFRAHSHREVPTNDGGISLGQVLVANARYRLSTSGALG